jgi:hypothetical protein
MPIDYDSAPALLEAAFEDALSHLISGTPPQIGHELFYYSSFETVFKSNTQAFREALLGCVIARILDREANIRQPYVNQGPQAFNGRTLDERVINPFLQDKRIPCSKGPYLSVFRRSVEFTKATREGIRDKAGYDQFLNILDYVDAASGDDSLNQILRYLMYRFLELRESSTIPLSRLHRMSLDQFDMLISGLLNTPSGGRFPMIVVIAALHAIKRHYYLDWEICWQGINVADSASGAGGDVTVSQNGGITMAAEVTERTVDRNRVISTFNTKIAPMGIGDYTFFVMENGATPDARQQARQYFAQGHELNFLVIREWVIMMLATMGSNGRSLFNNAMLELLELDDVPASLKVTWNEQVNRVVASQV